MQRNALAIFAALLFAAPLAARADIGVRAGLEVPVVTHLGDRTVGGVTVSPGTTTFADSLQPAVDVLISAYPAGIVGFDAEIREGFAATGGSRYSRTGTAVGPGITLNPPLIPVYVRASLPIHLEPGDVQFDLRAAAGFTFNLVVLQLYLEGALETPLAGSGVTAFRDQQLSLGAGVWFKF